ncbi:MAG: glycosyltransferase family 2 protein [Pseudomonadota bacterium]
MNRAQQQRGGAGSLFSVVIPCFNEEEVIRETHSQLHAALQKSGLPLEFIFVDDGSADRTLEILLELQRNDPAMRVVALSRNFGHQVAVTAGLEQTTGNVVGIIDADLQDPPEVFLEMLAAWREGIDVAYGQRRERAGETAFKRSSAKAFYRLINRISDVDIPLDTGDFRLMDRAAVDALLAMPERDRFVRGMVAWLGFPQRAIAYDRAARFAGETKYPLKKMLRFATDGLISFSLVPLRFATLFGGLVISLSMLGILYALVLRIFTNDWVEGWTLLFIAVLFIGGVQIAFLGVIGEYVGRIYGEAKRRPLYFLKLRAGFPDQPKPAATNDRHGDDA